MKDLGVADDILEIRIFMKFNRFILSQSHYVENILDKFFKGDNSIVKTPIDTSVHLYKNKDKEINQLQYSRITGSLMYIMNCTRLAIGYLVRKRSIFIGNSNMGHWKEMKKGTKIFEEYFRLWATLYWLSSGVRRV